MILLALAAVQAGPILPPGSPGQQASVQAYHECLSPIVRANVRAPEVDYQPIEVILQRISASCAQERAAARDALSDYVVANHPDLTRAPTEADKEELIEEATMRWVNGVATDAALQTPEGN